VGSLTLEDAAATEGQVSVEMLPQE